MLPLFPHGEIDINARRLERGAFQRYAKNLPLGCPLLRRSDDVWKLRSLQPSRGHPRRGLLFGGERELSVAESERER